MIITRKDLIQLCNQFLNDEINKIEIANFASTIMFSDQFDWDEEDEVLTDTISDWEKKEFNPLINKPNITLWKNRLESNIYKLDSK